MYILSDILVGARAKVIIKQWRYTLCASSMVNIHNRLAPERVPLKIPVAFVQTIFANWVDDAEICQPLQRWNFALVNQRVLTDHWWFQQTSKYKKANKKRSPIEMCQYHSYSFIWPQFIKKGSLRMSERYANGD